MVSPATRARAKGANFLHSAFLFCLFLGLMIALAGCKKQPAAEAPLPPLGPNAKKFYGSTTPKSLFDPLFVPPCKPAPSPKPKNKAGGYQDDPTLHAFTVLADVNDHRFTGNAADATNFRDAKFNDYQTHANEYWTEASYQQVDIAFTMPDRIVHMAGAYDDYFNRTFVNASLTTRGLNGKYPLALDGSASATIHVRDAHDRNKDVVVAPNGNFPDAAALALAIENIFKAAPGVPNPWVTCSADGQEVACKLDSLETKEGSFLRVKDGTKLIDLGLNGPVENPGSSVAAANLSGKTAAFPVNAVAGDSVVIEIRDKDWHTRRYTFAFPAGNLPDPAAVTALIVPALNTEFNWAESFDAGANRIGLRLLPAFSDEPAAIRVVGGTNLAKFGLDGPVRIDGVTHAAASDTVRGDRSKIISEALSLFVKLRADESGIPIDDAHKDNLKTLVENEMKKFESYMVLFVDQMVGPAVAWKRAGAGSGDFDISVPGAGGYTFTYQLNGRLMVGLGQHEWQVWTHELGHNLGFWDLYWKPSYDKHFDGTFDYLHTWSLMDSHWRANDVDGWHKNRATWIPPAFVADVAAPAAGATETHAFTLLPLEFKTTDYPGFGDANAPAAHLVRIMLSDSHWIDVENHQPAALHSLALPDDANGWSPPNAAAHPGGILASDAVDPFKPALYRPAVTVLNPDGIAAGLPPDTDLQARGMHAGDVLDFTATYPAYGGIKLRVLNEIAGPPGKPKAFKVEVERGPGDFLDLEIRPWNAPNEYGTADIWIDWPGNGAENYPNSDPPIGNGDPAHWSPDESVVNLIKVRVQPGDDRRQGRRRSRIHQRPHGNGRQRNLQAVSRLRAAGHPGGRLQGFLIRMAAEGKRAHLCSRGDFHARISPGRAGSFQQRRPGERQQFLALRGKSLQAGRLHLQGEQRFQLAHRSRIDPFRAG
jgi:M6 family metalloprotease-like protein